MSIEPAISFRPMTSADLPLFHEWLTRPHVAEWWQPTPSLTELAEEYGPYFEHESGVSPHLALLDGEPIGYVQSYVAMGAGDGWWPDESNPGVRGIDQFIAHPALLGRGIGTAIVRAFVRRLFEDPAVTRVQTDPSPDNARAIRCYEKAGFRAVGEIDTPDGPAVLMICERDEPPSAELARLFAHDFREHGAVPPVGTPEYRALRERDRVRRARARALLAVLRASGGASPADLYHAAWLLNHGDAPPDAREAHELAREAAERGHAPARWLAAAAYDRWCMYEGRPQRYGTQFVPDGLRIRMWDVEPATTDDERRRWDVPPLAAQLARAEELTRTERQPPMDGAPAWLGSALARWRAAEDDA